MANTYLNNDNKVSHFIRQVSGCDDKGKNILSVLCKLTFSIKENGECYFSDEQLPLSADQVLYEHNENLLKNEYDLYPFKKYCDIILKGNAHNHKSLKQFISEINIGDSGHQMLIQGNQKPYLDQSGKIKFSDIEDVEKIPLQFDYAYGGRDLEAEKKIEIENYELLQKTDPSLDLLAGNPYRYARNPEGKGFIVEYNKTMIDQLELPNIQDPDHLITPENIVLKNPDNWLYMPVPAATDWVSPVWFPRLAYAGLMQFENVNTKALKEVKSNVLESDIFVNKPLGKNANIRFTNGALPALQVRNEIVPKYCQLINIHPSAPKFNIKFPDLRPKIWVDGRNGKLLETYPVIHTILLEPDDNRLSIIWRGSAPALRPYLDEELKNMPFKVEY